MFFIGFLLVSNNKAISQTVISIGPTGGTYSSISAYLATNPNVSSGSVILELNSSYLFSNETLTSNSFVLPSVTGVDATHTITIRPATGFSPTFTSSASAPTILIKGGSYWIIEGRSGGSGSTQAMTIENTNTAGTAIQLLDGANNNTIQYCNIRSINQSTNSGTIVFGSNSSGINLNNSNNKISFCKIGDTRVTANNYTSYYTYNAIYSLGSANYNNSSNTVSDSEIFNFYQLYGGFDNVHFSAGILLDAYSNSWSIQRNSFYETTQFSSDYATSGNSYHYGNLYAIYLNGASSTNISNNYFGSIGALANNATSFQFGYHGVSCAWRNEIKFIKSSSAGSTSANATIIDGNTIRRLKAYTNLNLEHGGFIDLGNGNYDIKNNIFGENSDASSSPSIDLAEDNNVTYSLIKINAATSYNSTITNNTINGIRTQRLNSNNFYIDLYLFRLVGASNYVVNSNNIGGTSNNSIYTDGAGTAPSSITSIYYGSSGTNSSINSNTIKNITVFTSSNNNTGINIASGLSSVYSNTINTLSAPRNVNGIIINSTTAGQNIYNNLIYDLINTGSAAYQVSGIYYTGPTTGSNNIYNNSIHSLNSTNTNATLVGIDLQDAGNTIVHNNNIRLGVDKLGASISSDVSFYGIKQSNTASYHKVYYNSIYIGGGATGTPTKKSYAIGLSSTSSITANDRAVKNNIFSNVRTGGTNLHYVITASATLTGADINYNDYWSGTTNTVLTNFGGTDYTNLYQWATNTGKDNLSISSNPNFVLPTGTTATLDMHLSSASNTNKLKSRGVFVSTNTNTDIDGNTRSGITADIGSDDFTSNAISSIPPTVVSITRNASSVTNSSTISYSVLFSEAVTGVDASDFTTTIVASPSLSTGSISVTGTGANYTVTINSVTGNGTIRLDIKAASTGILNANNAELLAGFITGEVYTIDQTSPVITAITPQWGTSLNTSEAATSKTIIVTTSGVENNQVVTVNLNSQNYTSTITSNSATITISSSALTALADGNTYTITTNVSDAAGNAATQTITSFTVDKTNPTISSVSISTDGTNSAVGKWGNKINLLFTSSESISNPTVTISGLSATVTNTTGNNWSAYVWVSNSAQSDGAVAFTIAFADVAGNNGTTVSATSDASAVTLDRRAPYTLDFENATLPNLVNGTSLISQNGGITLGTTLIGSIVNNPGVGFSTNTFKAAITSNGGTNDWGFFTERIRLEANTTYQLTYDASKVDNNTMAVDITVDFNSDQNGSGYSSSYLNPSFTNVTVPMDGSKASYTYTFTTKSSPFEGYFRFGVRRALLYQNWKFYLDNIQLVKQCVAPTTQAASLTFTTVTKNTISNNFTAASGSPSGYLVVQYTDAQLSGKLTPTDGTTYTAGAGLGGTIISASTTISNTVTGLVPNTQYTYYVYTYNNTSCYGGPLYNRTSPLIGVKKTLNEAPVINGANATHITGTTTINSTVSVKLSDGTLVGTVTSTSNGSFDLSYSGITSGSTLKVTAVDATGNLSEESSTIVDALAPTLSNTIISSNNANSAKAKVDDIITVVLTASEPIQTPTVTIAGQSATVTGTSSTYTATYSVTNSTPQGTVSISVSYSDLAGNAGTTVTSTTNSSTVNIDTQLPTLSAVSISSNNVTTGLAKSGNTISLTFTTSEGVFTPTITIAGQAVSTTSAGNTYTATATVTNSSVEGVAAFSISFTDLSGNVGTAVTSTTNSSTVTIDHSSPTLSIVNIASNNVNSTKAKVGDVIAVTLTASESIQTPIISIAGQSATVTGSGNTYTGTVLVASNTITGTASINITYSDYAGNAGTISSTTNSSSVTIDRTAPSINTLTISSNNASPSIAKVGDIVTVLLTASEPIQTPTITIAGQAATVTGTSSTYTATYTVSNSTPQGTASISVSYSDLAGNAGTTATSTTNSSSLLIDYTAPTSYAISINQASITLANQSATSVNLTGAEVGTIYNYSVSIASNTITGTGTITNTSQTISNINVSSLPDGVLTYSVSLTDAASNQGAAVTQTVSKDALPPTVSSVTTTASNGSYKAGQIIPVVVNFTEPVNVTGTPQITLITGTSSATTAVNYSSGSGTSSLIFNYTIGASNTSADLNYAATTSLILNGGTIIDLGNNPATLTLPATNSANSLGGSANIVVDTQVPTVGSVVISSNNTSTSKAKIGDIVTVVLTASEPIQTPTVTIAGQVATVTGTSSTYTATYTVSNSTPQGTASISVSYSDLAGNAGTVATSTTNSTSVLIDYTAPNGYAISINQASITLANQSSTSVNLTGAEVGTTYNYSVSIASNTITGTGTITNTSQTISNINVSSLPDGVLIYSVNLTDAAGNQGAAVTQTVSKDALPASISSVTTTAANGSYKAGQVIPVVVNFNKPVNVTGTPQITLITGTSSATTAVNYSSGSGTSSLTFNYTIGASNTSTDLNYAATNSLSLNGGTIIDFGNNPATLTLPATNSANSLGGSANIVIDTQVPTVGSLVISSNNANSAKAKIGDIVTVVLTASEPIQTPTITIAGQSATVTGTSSTYTATYTVTNNTPQGTATISVSYTDLAGNAGTTATSTTNSSTVNIDTQVPTLSAVSISSNNTTTGLAKSGNTISLTFTTSEGIFTPTITIAGQAVSTTSSGNTYTATTTVTNSSVEGIAAISISFTDLSGNVGTAVTSATNSTTVTIDHTTPTLSLVNISSNNVNSTKAKIGDVITVSLTASEPIQAPSITIAGQSANVTGSGDTYTGTYTITNVSTQGVVTISVSYSDLTGNAGTISSTTNSSAVTIDRTVPTINTLTISSNDVSPTKAKIGDIVTVVLTASEPIQTPTITIAGQAATVTGTSSTYTATYTLTNSTPQGTASISVSYADLAGNTGTTATITTNSSGVLIDYTAPTGYSISINQASITVANQSSTSMTFSNAEVGATYNYSVSVASNTITGTGTITSTSQTVSSINVSSLPDGVLTYSVSLTDAAGNQGTVVTQTVSKDALPPSISSVSTTLANGSYKAGQIIPVVVNFTEPVTITGTPQITLVTGTSSATTAVNYSSGSGTSSLTFNYTVGSNDISSDLNYAATTSLSLNGGTIIDAGNNIATLTLPATNSANSLGGAVNIVIDTQVPTVASVVILSNNANSAKAKVGDIITVVLTASEPIQTPTVTIAGQAATVTGTSSTYTATYTVSNSTPEGIASIAVAYNDLAGNAGTTATTTTNASSVTVDKTAPVLNTVTVSSSNSNPALAKIGDVVTVTISSSEPINTPVVTIASNPISVTANTSSSFTATYTVSNTTTQGGSINITYSDVTGNIGTAVTSTTNSSTITIDRTAPVLNSVIISSNNANSTKAKVGDVITVALTASETIQTPSITIAGQTASITGTSNTYTGTYIVANTTTEGNAAIAINYSDLSGNVGTQITNSTNSSTVVVDRTAPSAYTVAWIPASINNQNFRSVGFTLTNAELGATYTYTIASGTTSITATGTVTSTTQTITGIDSYPVHDGLVTLSLIEKDAAGNIGTAATATINKSTNGAPTGTVLPITISQNDPNRVINLVQGLVDPDNDPLTVNSLQITYSLVNISNNQSLPINAARQAQFADVVSTSDLNGTNLSIETIKSKFLPANQKGVISISYIVTDGFNSVNESAQLEIIGANDQPTGNNVTINQVTVSGSNALVPLIEGLGVSSAVPGVDPDADSIQYVLAPSSNVQNGQFQFQPDGTFVFVPDNDYFGEQSFQYYVKDQSGIQQGPYTVKIVIRENPDVDGVPSLLEMLGTDNGDVNGDGIPDRKQNNITTFPITSFADFQAGLAWANDTTLPKPSNSNVGSLLIGFMPDGVTNLKDTSLKLDPYAKFSNVALTPKPTSIDTSSAVKGFATDVYSFQIEPVYGRHLTDMDGDSTNGKQTRFILNFPRGIKATTYLKKNRAGQWFSFLDDQKLDTWDEGATLINLDNDPSTIERIILTIKDGGIGDYDGIVNDTIVDPGALGEMNPLIRGVNLGAYNEGKATAFLLHDINDANSGIDKDAEGQPLFYRFAPNTDTLITKAIALDSLTGKLTVKNKDDFDFEAFVNNGQALLQFNVLANDPNNNSSTATYTLGILNVDEYPKILNGRSLTFVEKDSVSKPVVTIKALPDYQDITTFEILNEGDGTSFNVNKNTGVIKFNITPVFKTKENYRFSIKALDNVGHTDTAHFNVVIIPLPPAPVIGDTAVYKLNATSAPSSFITLVSQPVDGALIRWHFAGSNPNNWIDTLPRLPDSVGRYNYVVKTYDPYTHLFSRDSTIVSIVIRPTDPIVIDSTYIIGAINNPANIGLQVSGMPRSIFNYFTVDSIIPKSNGSFLYKYNLSSRTRLAPQLPTGLGKYAFGVNQVVNGIESDTIPLLVNMIEKQDVVHVYYKMDTPKLQANSTFNIPMQFVLTNKLSKPLDSIQLQTDIRNMIPMGAEFKVLSIKGTGNIRENISFDGSLINNLIAPGVTMTPLSSDTVKLMVNFIPKGFSGTLLNTALMNAKSLYGWVDMRSDKTPTGYTYEPTPVEIPEVLLKIPEIFTPNRDGINDKFVIVRPFGTKIDLEIFNRWGSVVYTNPNYQNEWDGKGTGSLMGQDLVDGGYYYKIKATNANGESLNFNGYVVIQR